MREIIAESRKTQDCLVVPLLAPNTTLFYKINSFNLCEYESFTLTLRTLQPRVPRLPAGPPLNFFCMGTCWLFSHSCLWVGVDKNIYLEKTMTLWRWFVAKGITTSHHDWGDLLTIVRVSAVVSAHKTKIMPLTSEWNGTFVMVSKGLEGDQPLKKGKGHLELIWSIKYIFAECGKRELFSSKTLKTASLKRQVTYCMQAPANKVTVNRLSIHLVFSSKLIFSSAMWLGICRF